MNASYNPPVSLWRASTRRLDACRFLRDKQWNNSSLLTLSSPRCQSCHREVIHCGLLPISSIVLTIGVSSDFTSLILRYLSARALTMTKNRPGKRLKNGVDHRAPNTDMLGKIEKTVIKIDATETGQKTYHLPSRNLALAESRPGPSPFHPDTVLEATATALEHGHLGVSQLPE